MTPRAHATGSRAATPPAATRSRTSASRSSRARRPAVLGPNGGGKTTLFRALLGELPVRRGTVELAGRPAYVPQTERTRLDFPVSALDVALMGAYGRTPWLPAPRRADRAAAAAALERVGLADEAQRAVRHALRRPAPAGADRPRARAGRAGAAARRAALRRRRGQRRAASRPCSASCAAEGRALLMATHDVHQARRLRPRAVPEPPPGGLRAAGRRRSPRPCSRRPTAPSWWCSRAGPRRSPSTTTRTDGLAHRPVRRRVHAARAGRGARARPRLRAARRLGAAVPPELRRRVAQPRHAARARARRAAGRAARAGRRRGRARGRRGDRARGPRRAARRGHRSGRRGLGAVRPRGAAGARARARRRGSRSCCSATCSASRPATSRRPPRSPAASPWRSRSRTAG